MDRSTAYLALLGLILGLVTTLPNKADWDIYSFHINATVTARYASTVITSRVANRMDESKEVEFHVRIPKNAFITKFRMFMDGEVYDGVVKAKEQAERQYTAAVSRGESAGIISSVGRTLEEFKTSVTVAAHKKVTFELTYEELLKRRLGKYELQIHARPMQPVSDFKVDVHINEDAGINLLEIKGGLSTKELANAITKTVTDKQAWVHFYPTVDQQKVCDSCSDDGLNGDLVIFYDVKRDVPFGDLMTADGYFVHHFAPSNLPRIPKNVVFVIDQSGSMHGRKMEQTRVALIHILGDLAEDDFFGIITFDSEIIHWKRELVQATLTNVVYAKTFAENIRDRGATDINRALLEGAQLLNAHPRANSASILILLTDGDPTSGETNPERIRTNVRKAIDGKFPLYCLGFGFDVNFQFLEKMSLDNSGVARRIYEDSDANLQLQGFYEEVATPLLTDVTMIYIGGTNLTQTNFSQYYNGSEIVVAGMITDNNIEEFVPEVVAISKSTRMTFSNPNATTESSEPESVDRIQRVWAYLTVKQLMEKELQLSGPEKEKVKEEAMDLSLKYSFVTPLTSMVVTKPPGEDSAVLNKPKEGEAAMPTRGRVGSGSGHYHSFGSFTPHFGGALPLRPQGPPGPPGPPGYPGLSGYYPGLSGIPGNTGYSGVGAAPPPMYPGPGLGSAADADIEYSLTMAHNPVIMPDMAIPKTMPDTRTPSITTPPAQRFLLRSTNVSLPLCFDVPAASNVKLLHHPSRQLDINGQLFPEENGGFHKIAINVQSDLTIEVDTAFVTVKQGQTFSYYSQPEQVTVGSVTMIIRDKEVDVSIGDIRFVILKHAILGKKLLWPVFRQLPLDDRAGGLLVTNLDYEEQPGSVSRLKVKGRVVDLIRSSAVDYSLLVPVNVDCWLLSTEAAFQRPSTDFYN